MNKKDKALAAHMLKMAAEEFGNHGCNDFNLAELGWTVEERRDLMKRMREDNGDPENFDPKQDYKYFMDWWLMSFFAHQLENEAKSPQYLCKDCGHPINGNYVSQHFHCTDVHPDDR